MSKPNHHLRGVVLDFDGLIVDTESVIFEAWRAESLYVGRDLLLEQFAAIVGRDCPVAEVVELLLGAEYIPDAAAISQRVWSRARGGNAKTSTLPGVRDLIDEVRSLGLALAVASSSPGRYVTEHLDRLQLIDKFDVIRCADDVGGLKCVVVPGPVTSGYDFAAADARFTTLSGVSIAMLAEATGLTWSKQSDTIRLGTDSVSPGGSHE